MNITYTWKINKLKVIDLEGRPSTVIDVGWIRIGVDIESGKKSQRNGQIRLDISENTENFVPFEQLTEQIVSTWVENKIQARFLKSIDDFISNDIQRKVKASIVTVKEVALPWSETPMVVEEPVVTEEPLVVEEPLVTEEPVVTEEPLVTEETPPQGV